jgi:uncharacterized protein (TIGR03435 family)
LVYGVIRPTPIVAHLQKSNVATPPAFTSASIHENKSGALGVQILYENDGLSATNYTLVGLLAEAYNVQETEIEGPEWMKSARYNVTARVDSSAVEQLRNLDLNQRRMMLQALLTDAFQIVAHREDRSARVYGFLVADGGPKLRTSKEAFPPPMGTLLVRGAGNISGSDAPVSELVDYFSKQLNRPLVDQTGLSGRYDFNLEWAPDAVTGIPGPSLLTALEQQLGLKLAEHTASVQFLVIDNVAKPSEN